jgi:uncharacterized lipoprotein YddW (UPF0748 family)
MRKLKNSTSEKSSNLIDTDVLLAKVFSFLSSPLLLRNPGYYNKFISAVQKMSVFSNLLSFLPNTGTNNKFLLTNPGSALFNKQHLSLYNHHLNIKTSVIFLFLFMLLCSPPARPQTASPKREFRGIWIATVENIDWPSYKNLSSDQQKQEFITIIDRLKKDKFNAVFIQIRPSSDALYESSIEPWSEWLTGQQGRSPSPYYDPLKFMIDECHKRGIEIHAWFNPFRSVMNVSTSSISSQHVSRMHPSWNITYGNYKWLNPGLPEVRSYVLKVVMDVVRRYPIDGVHFDDYFYPYQIKNQKFHDEQTFSQYSRGIRNHENWRRDNINLFVQSVSDSIKKVKPGLKFGISPSGIWKNKSNDHLGSSTRGSESFYATSSDSRKWLKEGWIDYLVPQVYWHIGNIRADYKTIADWWNDNSFGKNIYMGESVYRLASDNHIAWSNASQIPNQIKLNRRLNNIKGNVFFNTTSVLKNPLGLEDSLKNNYYKYFALTPQTNANDKSKPLPPVNPAFQNVNGQILLNWNRQPNTHNSNSPSYYVIYRFNEHDKIDISQSDKITVVLYGSESSWMDPQRVSNPQGLTYVITSLDQSGNESSDDCRISSSTVPIAKNLPAISIHSTNPNSLSVNNINTTASVSIHLASSGFITLSLYDLSGREVQRLFYGYKKEGSYQFQFALNNLYSKSYIVRLQTSGYYSSQKLNLN